MRVIAGTAKGKKLFYPDSSSLRPTLDRVKESIFNMISAALPDSAVMDLFAGAGQLGIEALSRGAKHCFFVEKNAAACAIIRKNLMHTGLTAAATILKGNTPDEIKKMSERDVKFDIVFADPPYRLDYFGCGDGINLLKPGYLCDIIAVNGLFVCEYDSKRKPCFGPEFREVKNRIFGQTSVIILKRV
ncbi:MAG: 16S rRNA (guanine(966)-N(2))-methyltransferase RsmD [bacterium]|nr:16S rRNA (guanine(966)-N(2))-methyltransferase RsmD [bacterium]